MMIGASRGPLAGDLNARTDHSQIHLPEVQISNLDRKHNGLSRVWPSSRSSTVDKHTDAILFLRRRQWQPVIALLVTALMFIPLHVHALRLWPVNGPIISSVLFTFILCMTYAPSVLLLRSPSIENRIIRVVWNKNLWILNLPWMVVTILLLPGSVSRELEYLLLPICLLSIGFGTFHWVIWYIVFNYALLRHSVPSDSNSRGYLLLASFFIAVFALVFTVAIVAARIM